MSLVKDMNKQFGGGATTASDDAATYKNASWIDTGCFTLNKAINPRGLGLPSGNMVEFFGDSATGKSVMGYHILKETQKQDGIAVVFDIEGALDTKLVTDIGIDLDNLIVIRPTITKKGKKGEGSKKGKKGKVDEEGKQEEDRLTPLTLSDVFSRTEWLIHEIRKQYGPDKLLNILWDTLAATPADEDLVGDEPGLTQGAIERHNKRWIMRIRPLVSETNTLWLILNQVFASPNSPGDALKSPGGKAVKFHSHIRIKWKLYSGKAGKIFDENSLPIGARLHFKVDKNRIGPPWREGHADWYFGEDGIPSLDYYGGYIEYLLERRAIEHGQGKLIVGKDSYQAKVDPDSKFIVCKYVDKMLAEHPELLEVK